MSESETPVAPGDPNAGAAIVLRMLQGAHPEDAEIVRDWLTTLPEDLWEARNERDMWIKQAHELLFGREELLRGLRDKTEYVNQLIAEQERRAEAIGEKLRAFAVALQSVVTQHTTDLIADAGDSRDD